MKNMTESMNEMGDEMKNMTESMNEMFGDFGMNEMLKNFTDGTMNCTAPEVEMTFGNITFCTEPCPDGSEMMLDETLGVLGGGLSCSGGSGMMEMITGMMGDCNKAVENGERWLCVLQAGRRVCVFRARREWWGEGTCVRSTDLWGVLTPGSRPYLAVACLPLHRAKGRRPIACKTCTSRTLCHPDAPAAAAAPSCSQSACQLTSLPCWQGRLCLTSSRKCHIALSLSTSR